MVRELDLKKPPSIAESIDWARALLLLGADDIDQQTFRDTMSIIVKHRTDLDVVAERVGVKLGGPPRQPGRLQLDPRRARRAAARVRRGAARARASPSGPASCSTPSRRSSEVPWTEPDDFREALAATLAKSPDDRRVFELVFDRFFFRAAELAAVREGVREDGGVRRSTTASRARPRGAARADRRRRCATATRAAMRDLARLAIAAFGRQGEGSGVIGVDVQRIRRALGLRAEPQPDLPQDDPRREGLPRDELRRFEALLRRELERAQIERTEQLPPVAAAQRARPRAALRAAAGPRRRAPRRRPAQAPPEDAGPGAARAQAPRRTSTCARTMRASLQTGGVPVESEVPARAPAPPRDLRALRRLDVA